MKFLPYAHQSISPEDIAAVSEVLASEIITRGEKVAAFEKAVADYCGAQYAVAFNSGTAALVASCFAAGLGPQDRLISTANTFIGTIAGAFHFGATPVLVDIDRTTGNGKLEQFIDTANQKASRGKSVLIPVHFSGPTVNMQELENQIYTDCVIIEDAAHAIGSRYAPDGPRVGSCAYSQMTAFSFHAAKTITTGEGGMVTTNDEEYAKRLRIYRDNGIVRNLETPSHYEVQAISNNFNFTAFQAALGMSQLARIDKFIEKRRHLVQAYREQLKELPVRLFTDSQDSHSAFHLFVVQLDFSKIERLELIRRLKEAGIGSQVHYIPLYRHAVCAREWGDLTQFFPETEGYYASALSLPLFYEMTLEDVSRVVESLKSVYGSKF